MTDQEKTGRGGILSPRDAELLQPLTKYFGHREIVRFFAAYEDRAVQDEFEDLILGANPDRTTIEEAAEMRRRFAQGEFALSRKVFTKLKYGIYRPSKSK